MRSLMNLLQRLCGGHINDIPETGDMDSGKLGTTAAWAAKKHEKQRLLQSVKIRLNPDKQE